MKYTKYEYTVKPPRGSYRQIDYIHSKHEQKNNIGKGILVDSFDVGSDHKFIYS